jgi:hypothetical protein
MPGVSLERVAPPPSLVPRLRLRWNRSVIALSGLALRSRLLAGDPRILVEDIGATDNSVLIDPFGLCAGEAAIVAAALRRHLAAASTPWSPPLALPPGNVAGDWDASVCFQHDRAEHKFRIAQDGKHLSGLHVAPAFSATLEGEIGGNTVSLRSRHPREAMMVSYAFDGVVSDNAMSGSFLVGASGGANQGPVADGQFGGGTWTARRSVRSEIAMTENREPIVPPS